MPARECATFALTAAVAQQQCLRDGRQELQAGEVASTLKALVNGLAGYMQQSRTMRSTFQIRVSCMARRAALAALLCSPSPGFAATLLGSAQNFAVLGHETVTNGHSAPNPTTQIFGNLGVTPGTSVTGYFPDGTVSGGTIHINDGVAQLALSDATTAYNTLAGLPFAFNFTGNVLGSAGFTTLTPGVYHFADSAQLTGALTLDFLGNPNASFVFQIGSTLTTASSSSVNVVNGGSLSSVYWQVVSSATLGTDTVFAGNILALASVTLDPRAEILCGRAFALTGAVAGTDNLVTDNCSAQNFGSGHSDFGSLGFSGGSAGSTGVPEPGTLALLLMGLGAGMMCALIRGAVPAFSKGRSIR
jgi:type VI secretion system secreted protein VgrG